VRPDGTAILVTRGTYRLTAGQSGPVTFQLQGNDYTFPAGDRIRLEVLPADSPYLRPGNGGDATLIASMTLSLPVH
jgi:hypothetical protein